jgi:trehalose 6-phosphate synthase/phosphatase
VRRLVLVSNRLPVTVRVDGDQVRCVPSAGGLATGLRRLLDDGSLARLGGTWIGWPGLAGRVAAEARRAADLELTRMGLRPLWLASTEVRRYYEGFANGVLWPLFHDQLDRLPRDTDDWNPYRRVNARFADAVASCVGPGDVAWIHDYQLSLVPGLLRARVADVRIGFFLHIPFPAPEVLRALPWRASLLEGLLGADLVGFQAEPSAGHFRDACARLLGARTGADWVDHHGRRVRVGVFPMGVDVAAWEAQGRDPSLAPDVARVRRDGGPLLLGVDRLDYTKGIPRRLLAWERLLVRHPELRGRARLLQVAVPSRETVPAYRELRRVVEGQVGRINGALATSTWTPVQYLGRGVSERALATLYRAADVMVVTPLRDGMNLVAKEFCATRVDGDGVLVLSELAGAADELGAALRVHPYDVEGMAETLHRAVSLPPDERRARMAALRARVAAGDVHDWARAFLDALDAAPVATPPAPRRAWETPVRRAVKSGRPLAFLLDYDGTLVPFAPRPELAAPDAALTGLIGGLAEHAAVHVVSGRGREELEGWFGGLRVALHAEHGAWSRGATSGVDAWRPLPLEPSAVPWHALVEALFAPVVAAWPGAHVERKERTRALHWRACPHAREAVAALRPALSDLARWLPVDVLEGDRVLEVRPRGVHKGRIIPAIAATGALIVALGDDRTDEDVFTALPPGAVSVRVGSHGPVSAARWAVKDPAAARALLARCVALLGARR